MDLKVPNRVILINQYPIHKPMWELFLLPGICVLFLASSIAMVVNERFSRYLHYASVTALGLVVLFIIGLFLTDQFSYWIVMGNSSSGLAFPYKFAAVLATVEGHLLVAVLVMNLTWIIQRRWAKGLDEYTSTKVLSTISLISILMILIVTYINPFETSSSLWTRNFPQGIGLDEGYQNPWLFVQPLMFCVSSGIIGFLFCYGLTRMLAREDMRLDVDLVDRNLTLALGTLVISMAFWGMWSAQEWGRAWGFDSYESLLVVLLVFLIGLHWALHNRHGSKSYVLYTPYLIIPFIIYFLGLYVQWSGKWENVTGRTLDSRWFIVPLDSPWLILGTGFIFLIAGIFVSGAYIYKSVGEEDVKGWTRFPSTLGLGFGWVFYGILMFAILGVSFPNWKVMFTILGFIVLVVTLLNYVRKGRKFGFTDHSNTVFFAALTGGSFFFLLARLIEPIRVLFLILALAGYFLAGLVFTIKGVKQFNAMREQTFPEKPNDV